MKVYSSYSLLYVVTDNWNIIRCRKLEINNYKNWAHKINLQFQ